MKIKVERKNWYYFEWDHGYAVIPGRVLIPLVEQAIITERERGHRRIMKNIRASRKK